MTSKEINEPPSGFYYDAQLENPMLKVTLHANTEEGPAPRYSQPWSADLEEDAEGEYPYGLDPICQSIVSEDFQVSVSNNTNNFGGDPLGDLWNSAVKPYSSYLNDPTLAKDLSFITDKINGLTNKWVSNTEQGSVMNSLAEMTNGATAWLKDIFANGHLSDIDLKGVDKNGKEYILDSSHAGVISKAAAITSRSLVVQGTQFAYYSGTGTDFGSLSMKFVVFSGYDSWGNYRTVEDQLALLKWYTVGRFIPCKEAEAAGDGGSKKVPEFIKNFASWQIAPGGYIAGIKNIDEAQYGTLKLRVGPFYSIENLIISGAQFNYSKTMCKVPATGDDTTLDPLFCEVMLTLKPVTKFSGDAMFNFAHGKRTEKYREKVVNKMKTDLKAIKSVTSNPRGINTY